MIIKTEEVMKKFEEAGAIQKGHFKLFIVIPISNVLRSCNIPDLCIIFAVNWGRNLGEMILM